MSSINVPRAPRPSRASPQRQQPPWNQRPPAAKPSGTLQPPPLLQSALAAHSPRRSRAPLEDSAQMPAASQQPRPPTLQRQRLLARWPLLPLHVPLLQLQWLLGLSSQPHIQASQMQMASYAKQPTTRKREDKHWRVILTDVSNPILFPLADRS